MQAGGKRGIKGGVGAMSWDRLEEGELSVLPSNQAGRASSSTVDGGSRMGACVVDLLSLLLTFLCAVSLFGCLSLSPLCLPPTLHPSSDPLPHPVRNYLFPDSSDYVYPGIRLPL